MSDQPNEQWEARLQGAAREFRYPPTPDIAVAVRRRLTSAAQPTRFRPRLAWAAIVAALILLAGLMAVPQVRAAVIEFLRIGAIRIFLVEPTPTPTVPAVAPTSTLPTATPRPSPTPLSSVLDLAGETNLADARAKAGFLIRLPTYPTDLGPPDRVFLQSLGGPVVVLVWLDPNRPDRVRLSLHELGPGTFGEKVQPQVIQETTVHGERALWTEGPYMIQLKNGDYDVRRLVMGHVLIWTVGEVTLRLETDLSLEEAVRIAESLR